MGKAKRRGHGEGSIYQRSDGRWAASMSSEDGKRKYLYGKTRKEVQEKLRLAISDEKQGISVTGPNQTMRDYLEYWLEDVHKPRLRIGTYKNYRAILNKHLFPALGNIQLRKLTPDHVQKCYTQCLRKGLAPGSIKNVHIALHAALAYAVRTGRVVRNVCDSVDLPRKEEHEAQILTPEQAVLFLQKVSEHRLEAISTLALTTGMRIGELLSLRWQDIDLQKKILHVRRTVSYYKGYGYVVNDPKSKHGKRDLALADVAIEKLKIHKARQDQAKLSRGDKWVDHDLVFCGRYGRYTTRATIMYHFSKLLREIGLPHMRFHDLRHSAATLLLSMGVPLKVVQEMLGHSSIVLTGDLYSHVVLSMQQEAMDKMNNLLGDGKG